MKTQTMPDNPSKTSVSEIPEKMKGFEEFVQAMRDVICQGADKYTGKQKDTCETIDVIPMVLGEEGYRHFILADLLKRIFRLKNQNRARDNIKSATWHFLYWKRFHYGKTENGTGNGQ